MSAQASNVSTGADDLKGKGKAAEKNEEVSMDEAEDESESDEEVPEAEPEDEDDDNMEEISSDNIVSGGRTRAKIDYVKAAEQAVDLDDDEDDDDDFEVPEDPDRMEE